MKVTVYGGTHTNSFTQEELEESNKLGRWLGERKIEILTGACRGFPYFVGKEAATLGSKVVGFSPALNKKEHVEKYSFPTDGVTKMVYNDVDGSTKAENFLRRSLDMNHFSDIVIALSGSWGTYIELIFSFFFKKTIILIENFGGATEAFWGTYRYFDERDNNLDVHHGARIIRCKNVDDAIKELDRFYKI
ncbi:MAG: hypothetical protein FWE31_05070 [Firmicutes bacterium]|nr:hypothetical protein [Bacillota bacterium]